MRLENKDLLPFLCLFVISSAQTVRGVTTVETYDHYDGYSEVPLENDLESLEPTFDVPTVNISIVAGQTAVLPCSIDHLGGYNVIWSDKNDQFLTSKDKRIVEDHRYSIERPFRKEWNLQIRDVTHEDEGEYRCTINTSPVRSKIVYLIVKVPPRILKESSSGDVTVKEGDTVQLVCNATGIPQPSIMWYRLSALSPSRKERIGMSGEMVIIHNVTRDCDGSYQCEARNGIRPTDTHRMDVTVHFAPEVTLNVPKIGQSRGKDTILECKITAFPQARMYWARNGKEIVTTSNKYKVEAYEEGGKTITLSLSIENVQDEDFGDYVCHASNTLDTDSKVMLLYEYIEPKRYTPPRVKGPKKGQRKQNNRNNPQVYNQTPGPAYDQVPKVGKNRNDYFTRSSAFLPSVSLSTILLTTLAQLSFL